MTKYATPVSSVLIDQVVAKCDIAVGVELTVNYLVIPTCLTGVVGS